MLRTIDSVKIIVHILTFHVVRFQVQNASKTGLDCGRVGKQMEILKAMGNSQNSWFDASFLTLLPKAPGWISSVPANLALTRPKESQSHGAAGSFLDSGVHFCFQRKLSSPRNMNVGRDVRACRMGSLVQALGDMDLMGWLHFSLSPQNTVSILRSNHPH